MGLIRLIYRDVASIVAKAMMDKQVDLLGMMPRGPGFESLHSDHFQPHEGQKKERGAYG
jgi:hypothetical protein